MEDTKITGITYNWYYSPCENSEGFTHRSVGSEYNGLKVDYIKEHAAMGEGDKWFYDIIYSDKSIERIFNPNAVFFKSTKP